MHAQHRQHHQSTQLAGLNERNRDRPNNLQLPKKGPMPHARNCQATNIIYNAEVKENNNSQLYIGLTEPPFKLRYNNHTQSFKHEKHQNSTELSKHIWQLKRNKKPLTINWSIPSRAQTYNSESKRCNLCLTEKLHILNAEKHSLLNKRPELISKCRHENKFYLRNFKRDNTWNTTPSARKQLSPINSE